MNETTAQRHGVCPRCEGYGGGEEPEGHENSDCEGSCPECWCPGCHDGESWEAYAAVRVASKPRTWLPQEGSG